MYNFIRRLQAQTWVLLPRPLVAEWNFSGAQRSMGRRGV